MYSARLDREVGYAGSGRRLSDLGPPLESRLGLQNGAFMTFQPTSNASALLGKRKGLPSTPGANDAAMSEPFTKEQPLHRAPPSPSTSAPVLLPVKSPPPAGTQTEPSASHVQHPSAPEETHVIPPTAQLHTTPAKPGSASASTQPSDLYPGATQLTASAILPSEASGSSSNSSATGTARVSVGVFRPDQEEGGTASLPGYFVNAAPRR